MPEYKRNDCFVINCVFQNNHSIMRSNSSQVHCHFRIAMCIRLFHSNSFFFLGNRTHSSISQIKKKKLIRKMSNCLEFFDIIAQIQKEIDQQTREISIQLTSSQEKQKSLEKNIGSLLKKIKFSPPLILFSACPFKDLQIETESVEIDILSSSSAEIENCLLFFSSSFEKISQKIELISATTNNMCNNSSLQRTNNSQRTKNTIILNPDSKLQSKKSSEIVSKEETKPFFKTSNGLK